MKEKQAKKTAQEVQCAQIIELKKRLARAIVIGRDAVNYSYPQRDSAQENLDELASLEKFL